MNRKIYTMNMPGLLLAFLSLTMVYSASAQVSVTTPGGMPGTTAYSSVSDAFTAINAGTHMGTVDIAITGNTTEPASVTALLNSSGTSSYSSVLIHPVGGDWTINSAATPTASRGVIELRGADNVTIDGDDPATAGTRNLTISAAASANTGVAAVRLSSNSTSGTDGADFNTIKNCIIIGSRNSATSTAVNYGINMSNYSATSMTTGAYSSVNTTIQNNDIRRAYYGIYANGASATYLNTNTVIQNNIIGSATAASNIGFRGIFLAYTSVSAVGAALVQNNDIRVGTVAANATGYAATIAGIEFGAANAECTITANNIHDVMQPSASGYGAYGINIPNATSNDGIKITNNFIRDIVASKYSATLTTTLSNTGIRVSAAITGLVINNNTIAFLVQNVNGSVANHASIGISIGTATAALVQMQNNIVVNMNASSNALAIYTAGTGNLSTGNVNNNNYYTPGGTIGYYNAGLRTTLADWQTATLQDIMSLNVNPAFISAFDVHIQPSTNSNALESSGAYTTTFTDIDGEARPGPAGSLNGGGTAPDIGADEFDGKPAPALDLGATSLVFPANTAVVGAINNFTPQASFTNYGSAAQTNVSVRYQIINASNTIVYNNTTAIPAIAAYTGMQTASFPSASILTAGTYTIKAIAQLAGDLTTTNDTVVGTITVVTPLCGTYHIGAAQPAPFNTFTSAVNTINAAGVTCPVLLLLDDAAYNEPNLIQFNSAIAGVSALNTVTVKPNTGANVSLTGNITGAFIKILSSYVTIDGSNTMGGTSRNLTIANMVTGSIGIIIGSVGTNPITDVTIKNCNVIDTVTHTPIAAGNESGAAGYINNITIQNNDIKRGDYAFTANAVNIPGNGTGILVTGNLINSPMPDAIRRIAIRLDGINGAVVSNNHIANMETATSLHKRGIYLSANTTNTLVKGNTIENLGLTATDANGSVQAIGVVPATGIINPSNNVVDSNYISNIISTSSTTGVQNQTYGICVFGAVKGVTVTRNRITNIQNTNATGFAAYGINLQSTGDTCDILVANNFISEINSQGASALENNAHGIFINDGSGYSIHHNSINLTTTAQSGTEVSGAITIGSAVSFNGPVMDIRNNIFSNSNTSGAPYAIYSAVTAANNATTFLNLDYNDYFSAGLNLAYFSGATQANLASLQGAFAGTNTNSISIQPTFTSGSDLHLQNAGNNNLIVNMGTPLTLGTTTTDIDGQARPIGAATDMGADEFTISPLSIKLGDISAANEGSQNKIDWRSASEVDADRYILEKSTDGKVFSPLGTVKAKGQATSYSFWDEYPAAGICYYRLQMHSVNGGFTYSKIVQASFNSENALTIVSYPNPAIDNITLEVKGAIRPNAVITISDIYGKHVFNRYVSEMKSTISVTDLIPGIYFVTYTDDNTRQTIKINKR